MTENDIVENGSRNTQLFGNFFIQFSALGRQDFSFLSQRNGASQSRHFMELEEDNVGDSPVCRLMLQRN